MSAEAPAQVYTVSVACSNCREGQAQFDGMWATPSYTAEIPKGVAIESYLRYVPCRRCGCRGTLGRWSR